MGCKLPASGVGAGLLRDGALVVVAWCIVRPFVENLVTALEDAEVDVSEVEGSP